MSPSTPFHCLTLSLLLIPPLLFTTYLLASFPSPPAPIHVHHSLAALPPTAKSWQIYPEDFYPGGAYAELPFGKVRYWLLGPENGKKIVLIHGLSIPAIIWKDIAPALASNGYRVLLYDLYGRGYSDAPQTTYSPTLYSLQLALLLQHIHWSKTSLCGVSMGGGIVAAFTQQFPNLVDEEVVLIASAGIMDSADISRTAKFMSVPVVQMVAGSGVVRKYLQRLADSSSSSSSSSHSKTDPTSDSTSTSTSNTNPSPILEQAQFPLSEKPLLSPSSQTSNSIQATTDIVRLQSAHLPGYNAALSSSLRAGPIRGQEGAFGSKGWEGRRVLLIHGTKDTTVHPKYAPRIMRLLPASTRERSRLVMVEGAGHDLTVSHGERVVREMRGWFEEGREEAR